MFVRSHVSFGKQFFLKILPLLNIHPVSEVVLELIGAGSTDILANGFEGIAFDLDSDKGVDKADLGREVREIVIGKV